MPQGKPAGVRCIHLSDDDRCRIYDAPGRPAVCAQFTASAELCGDSREDALRRLADLEQQTRSSAPSEAESVPEAPGEAVQ